MPDESLARTLRPLFIFDGLTDEQLAVLAEAGDVVEYAAGDTLFTEGSPADHWWVLLEGRVDLVRRAGHEEAAVLTTMERPGVWAGGFRAWNPESNYLATGRGELAGRAFRVPSARLGELAQEWFPFSIHIIEGFFQTVRSMDSLTRQRESLIALGQLAAGLAHELNNPAAAASRSVDALGAAAREVPDALARLAAAHLSPSSSSSSTGSAPSSPSGPRSPTRSRSPTPRTSWPAGSTTMTWPRAGSWPRRWRGPPPTSRGATASPRSWTSRPWSPGWPGSGPP